MSVEVVRSALLDGVRHGFLGRRGGVSEGLIAGLNCGFGADDLPEAVGENRRRAIDAVAPGALLVQPFQVHSADVVTVAETWAADARPRADALVTDRPGIALGIFTADCAPVLLADVRAGVIGAAHAGWKGAFHGITDMTIAAMERLGAHRDRIVAAVGPCIAQASYEVDDAFRARFVTADSGNERFFASGRPGHAQFDLEAYVAHRLEAAGVGTVDRLGEDTLSQPSRFFSFRRATLAGEADYGRQISLIALPERAARRDQLEDESQLTAAPQRRRPKPDILAIDNRRLAPETLMMGHGFDPALSEGSLKPPIFLTSTFVFENAAAGKRFFEGVTGKRPGGAEGLVYSRFNGPNQEILEDRLCVWEDAEDALVFSSGMSAIATVMLALVQPGDVIVHSGPMYAATETLIGRILGRFGVAFLDFPAGATREEIDVVMAKAKTLGHVALVYLESPANPTNALVDVEAVSAARDAAFASDDLPPIVIDNTFLGPLWAKPLKQGADLVLYSLTKYAGGHSDLVAGGAVGGKGIINTVRMMRNTIGTITDPHSAWMLLRSLETLELRMSRAGENAAKVCAFLRAQPQVESVGYLGFLEPGTRQRDIYERHCTGAGSTFSLYLKGGEAESFRFLDALKIAKLAVSLGGTETLASHPAAMTHLSVPQERKDALGIGDNLVRISVGVENADDLIADFGQALRAI